MSNKRVIIVGGVAGGMSCATRLRRLDEQADITVLERGPYPSFANCGLPYHIGGEISDRSKLIVQTPENLAANFNLKVRTLTEAIRIDRALKLVEVRDHRTGATEQLPYDALVLSMGANPLKPPIPGIDLPGVFTLRNIPDMDRILAWIAEHSVNHAVIGGGGFIGLEVAEQLVHRGIQVELAEALPQILAPLDPEIALPLQVAGEKRGITFHLNAAIASFEPNQWDRLGSVMLKNGTRISTQLVVMGLGVRPEATLARDAGLELGQRGGIRVDEQMRTSDPAIYAVGDVVEVKDRITDEWAVIPLAGPANRQGRIAADNIAGIPSRYRSTQGTAILKFFSLAAACTGANEKTLKRVGKPYKSVHLHPGSHAGYFPGAKPVALKLLFDPNDGRVLGAQAVGEDGIDKRIDVVATAIAAGMTIDDLAELELCYAPPFGSAKDPVNLAGMAAQNLRAGLVEGITWPEYQALPVDQRPPLLDVRNNNEVALGMIPGAIHIPLAQLRSRMDEVPHGPVVVYCQSGQRSYNACRILRQHGRQAINLSGAYKTYLSH